MRRVAAVVAIAGLLVAGLLLGAPAAGALGRAAAGVPLELDLDEMTPRIVTTEGPDSLVLAGRIVNAGDQPVDDIVVRVQRGNPLTTEGAIRDALDGKAPTDAVTPQFVPVADSIAPGGSVPLRLVVPLRGAPQDSLALAQTGVHELLVNVNGSPQGGTRARVSAVRLLLPVLSLPPLPGQLSRTGPVRFAGTQFSLLYPIAERPHRIPTLPGEPVLLTDDTLAVSFSPGGRLSGLVAALTEQAPVGSQVRAATCVAIDPDLVETAEAMRRGYQVRARDGTLTPGAGAQVAGQWVDQLVAATRGGCVLALPYADADLVALARSEQLERATTAVTDGREALAERLGIPEPPAITWPADGALDDLALEAVGRAGDRALVLSADSVEQGRTRAISGVVPLDEGPVAVLADPLLALAARGPSSTVNSGGIGEAPATTSPAGTDTPLSTQDLLSTLAFRTQTAAPDSDAGGPLVLAPPHRWATEGTGARALLAAAADLVAQGGLVARNVVDVARVGPGAAAPVRSLDYPEDAGEREVPPVVAASVRGNDELLADLLTAAAEPGPDSVGVSPEEAFGPVRQSLVRATSATLRGDPDAAGDVAAMLTERMMQLRGSVQVLAPPIPYSLGTSDAPLPLTIVNGLPVTVRVRVEVAPTAGLRVAPIPELTIPPLGRRQISMNANVTRSGQFSVDATVRTPGGGMLGEPSRLKVVSTAYGTISVWLTATAGVLLVALVAHRVVRRRRGEQAARPDPGHPPNPRPGDDTDRLPGLPPAGGPSSRLPGPPVPEHLAPTDPFPRRVVPPGGPPGPRTTTPRS